jgi:hypothetical protein
LIIVTRPPGVIVTLDGLTRPSAPIVIVAVDDGVVGVVGVVGLVGLVGVVGVLLLPPLPQAAAVAATTIAAASPFHITLVISRISSKD